VTAAVACKYPLEISTALKKKRKKEKEIHLALRSFELRLTASIHCQEIPEKFPKSFTELLEASCDTNAVSIVHEDISNGLHETISA